MISRRGLLRLMGVTATSLVVPGLWTPEPKFGLRGFFDMRMAELDKRLVSHYASWRDIYIPPQPEEPPVFLGPLR